MNDEKTTPILIRFIPETVHHLLKIRAAQERRTIQDIGIALFRLYAEGKINLPPKK